MKRLGVIAMTVVLVLAMCSCGVSVRGASDVSQTQSARSGTGGGNVTAISDGADITQSEEMAAYLFVHFIDNEETADKEQIYFSVSANGTNWQTINYGAPVLKSTVGERGVRDPHIIRRPDGRGFYLIATDLSIYNINGNWGASQTVGSHNIVIWESEDLVHWSEPRLREIAAKDAGCTWAPESVWDDERQAYMVFWASMVNGLHRVYRCYTTDFDTFTAPEVYIESKVSVIDTTFIKEGDTYYRFTKNEAEKYVYMEKSNSLSGDFEEVATYTLDGRSCTAEGHLAYEGPTVYKLNGEDKWCLLLDSYNYRPFITDDIATGRFVSASEFNFNGVLFRHGTVIPITQSEYDGLKAEYDPQLDPPPTPVFSMGFATQAVSPESGAASRSSALLSYDTGVKGSGDYAAKFSSGTLGKAYITITQNAAGANPLAGLSEFTVSFAVKPSSTGCSWWFYAAPNTNEQVWPNEHYLGVRTEGGKIICQRYDNSGSRPADLEANCTTNAWQHVTVVCHAGKTQLYVNGILSVELDSSVDLASMLGATPVIQLGKANWGSSGEYADGCIDSVRIHDKVLDATEVFSNYRDAMGL